MQSKPSNTTQSALESAMNIGLQHRSTFDWDTPQQVITKIFEELSELRLELSQNDTKKIAEEFSDLLFTILQLARHLNLAPEHCLDFSVKKYLLRFNAMEELIKDDKKSLESLNLKEKETYWSQAKNKTDSQLKKIISEFFKP